MFQSKNCPHCANSPNVVALARFQYPIYIDSLDYWIFIAMSCAPKKGNFPELAKPDLIWVVYLPNETEPCRFAEWWFAERRFAETVQAWWFAKTPHLGFWRTAIWRTFVWQIYRVPMNIIF
jgi:hypothetical protein